MFLTSTVDQSHHLVKLSCKSSCEDLDAKSARSNSMLFAANIAVSKKSSCPTSWLLFIHFI